MCGFSKFLAKGAGAGATSSLAICEFIDDNGKLPLLAEFIDSHGLGGDSIQVTTTKYIWF